MSENDRAFHTSVKPTWTTDNTLVYAIAGNTPQVAGNMATAKRSVISESRDIRFAQFVTQNVSKRLVKRIPQMLTLQQGYNSSSATSVGSHKCVKRGGYADR